MTVQVRLDGLFTSIHLILCFLIPLMVFALPPSVQVCYDDEGNCWDDKNGACVDGEKTMRICDFTIILAAVQLALYCAFFGVVMLSSFFTHLMDVFNIIIVINAFSIVLFEFIMILACPILFYSSPDEESCETGAGDSCADIMDHSGLFYTFWASRFMGVVLWCAVIAKEVRTRADYIALPDSAKRSYYQITLDHLMFVQWKKQEAQVIE